VEQTYKHRARDALETADLRHYRTSTSLDVARRRGPRVLRDLWRPVRPRFFGAAVRDYGLPGAAKNTGDFARLFVMPGLDPGIHDEVTKRLPYVSLPATNRLMDCRDKPGNDSRETLRSPLLFGYIRALFRSG
jgi:hypothetical protein